MKLYWYIGLGGFAGAIARYGLSNLMRGLLELPIDSFPWWTLSINILGSFLMGLVLGALLKGFKINEELTKFLTVGFISSFTTFSTFSYEIYYLLIREKLLLGLSYAIVSILLGLSLCWLGVKASSFFKIKGTKKDER